MKKFYLVTIILILLSTVGGTQSFAACRADIDSDGWVTDEDLSSFQNLLFARSDEADIDQNGSTDIHDFLLYLEFYFEERSIENIHCADYVCGNNILEADHEQCDDGNTIDGDGCSASCQLEIDPSIVIHLPLNNSINDSSSYNQQVNYNHPNSTGTFSPGVIGQGFRMNGTSLHNLVVDHSPNLEGFNEVTFAGWFKKDQTHYRGNTLLRFGSYNLKVDRDQFVVFLSTSAGTFFHIYSNPSLIETTDWHHYAVTYDGSDVKIFIDGILVDSAPHSGTVSASGSDLYIGRLAGTVDEIYIFNRALSTQEVSILYTLSGLPPQEYCGDDVIQSNNNEVCEVGDFRTCTTSNGYPGEELCNDLCSGFDACDSDLRCGDGTCTSSVENIENCREDCGPVCGNGIQQLDEECDDGNLDNNDGCNSQCEVEFCGDGVRQLDEECDDGNLNDEDNCDANCNRIGGVSECNDGIDNDNDGLVDWSFDLGCTGPEDLSEGGNNAVIENGWTVYEPHPTDTQIVFVSSSDPNANDHLCQPYTLDELRNLAPNYSALIPCQTIVHARFLTRNNSPDWILLKRGDTFDEDWGERGQVFGTGKRGPSGEYPIIYASYGDSIQRPRILTGTKAGLLEGGEYYNISVLGLHFYAHEYQGINGATVGIKLTANGDFTDNFVIEDNKIENFKDGISILISAINLGDNNVTIRRNVIVDQFSVDGGAGHSQGIFVSGAKGLLIEENILDHNGWNESIPDAFATIFSHNIYIYSGAYTGTIRNNIIANASASGVQLRPGGLIENNLFVGNAIAGHASAQHSEIRNNVVLAGRHILDPRDSDGIIPRGHGLSLNPVPSGIVEDNIIAHSQVQGDYALRVDNAVPRHTDTFTAHFRNNITYNWQAPGFNVHNPNNSVYDDIHFTNNTIVEHNESVLVRHRAEPYDPSRFTYADNIYYTEAPSNHTFEVNSNGSWRSWEDWQALTGDNSTISETQFVDPNRDVGTYHASIGGAPSTEAFLDQARLQSKFNWREQFTANAVNSYVREGFQRVLTDPVGPESEQTIQKPKFLKKTFHKKNTY